MAFLIVLNNKELNLIGMLLFFIANGNLIFRFPNNGSLNYLDVTTKN
jgi:hypothetical protein